MSKRTAIALFLFVLSISNTYSQSDYLEKGNSYLNNMEFEKAEQIFREAIQSDSGNLIYQSQLALTLIQSKKFAEGQKLLDEILKVDPKNVGAIWYSGIGFYNSKSYLEGNRRFEEALLLLDFSSPQYYSAHWFIAAGYSNLLKTEGLTFAQTDRMFECFEEYLRLQPNAPDAEEIKDYVEYKKKRRPPSNVKVWIDL